MLIDEELARLSPDKEMALTIGVFDGVHLGHKYLISRLKEHAKRQNLLSGVVTFHQHPLEVLSPRARLSYLTTLTERTRLLRHENIDEVIVVSFTPELAELSAREFVSLLQKYLKMRGLVIGPDFALGKRREGSVSALRALAQYMNFTVTVIPPVRINGEVVSSTAIRNALANGDMRKVNNLAGRYFCVSGRVISGTGRGVGLGFPTANLEIASVKALPPDGVYATRAHIDSQSYKSVTNIGTNPTFGDNQRSVEVHVLDYHGNLYEQEIKVDFIERLRGEQQFSTAEELARQIAEDIKQGRTVLASQGRN